MAFLGQFLASLAAILALAWIARRLGLGRDIRIRGVQHAQMLADEVVCGFEALETVVDENGTAALLRDRKGRTILIKRHGAQFAGRILGAGANAVILDNAGRKILQVDSGERLFGAAFLHIDDPENWVISINADRVSAHA